MGTALWVLCGWLAISALVVLLSLVAASGGRALDLRARSARARRQAAGAHR
jgi:hypothetical protein